MRILPFRTTACLIRGDDLVTVGVSGSAFGARVKPGPVIERFLDPSVRMTELGHDRWLVEVGER